MGLRFLLTRIPLRLRITIWVMCAFAIVQSSVSLVLVLYRGERLGQSTLQRLVEAAHSLDPQAPRVPLAHAELLGVAGGMVLIEADAQGRVRVEGAEATEALERLGEELSKTPSPGRRGTFTGHEQGFYFAARGVGQGHLLVLATPTRIAHAPLRPFAGALLLLLPTGMIASGVSAWYVASLAVRPIRQVREFAEDLSAQTVDDPLALADGSPEVQSLREELNHALRRISKGYDAQARFLATVSHEIKTPIAVVRTEGEVLLASDPDETKWQGFARSTVEEMERLGRMLDSFLLLTRVRQGKGAVNMRPLDANDLLMEAVGWCVAMARQYGVRLEPILWEGDCPPLVTGQAELLSTALANLIRNAIRFSPEDRAIRIACEVRDDRVCLSVRDFGPGLPPEVLEHLFEPYNQGDTEARRGRGNGLGLQIAHGIVELHGGRARARNLDPGCEFTLCLPCSPGTPDRPGPE